MCQWESMPVTDCLWYGPVFSASWYLVLLTAAKLNCPLRINKVWLWLTDCTLKHLDCVNQCRPVSVAWGVTKTILHILKSLPGRHSDTELVESHLYLHHVGNLSALSKPLFFFCCFFQKASKKKKSLTNKTLPQEKSLRESSSTHLHLKGLNKELRYRFWRRF